MQYEIRPLGMWTGPVTRNRPYCRFRASWSDTLVLLERETETLGARLVVLQVDATEGDIRRDGMLRANARVAFPGVRVSFESRHGPLTYATDRYDGWQDNIRAVALSLEALRAVDEFGIAGRGQQYVGNHASLVPINTRLDPHSVSVPLCDRDGRVVAEAVVDAADEWVIELPWYRLRNGYAVRTEKRDGRKVMVYLHRELLGLGTFEQNPVAVDHIDTNRLNNRRANLRAATAGQNGQNRGANRGRTLPRGVHYRPDRGDYLALAKLDGQRHEVGYFGSPQEADEAIRAWRARRMPFSKDARAAARKLDPDHGGDPEQFRRLTEARALLDAEAT